MRLCQSTHIIASAVEIVSTAHSNVNRMHLGPAIFCAGFRKVTWRRRRTKEVTATQALHFLCLPPIRFKLDTLWHCQWPNRSLQTANNGKKTKLCKVPQKVFPANVSRYWLVLYLSLQKGTLLLQILTDPYLAIHLTPHNDPGKNACTR